MPLTAAGLNIAADAFAGQATHIGLVDNTGTELTGGAYARLPTSWTAAADGLVRPTADLTFDVPAGADVSGWRAYTALTAGSDLGGEALTREDYAGAGEYTLQAASTGVDFN